MRFFASGGRTGRRFDRRVNYTRCQLELRDWRGRRLASSFRAPLPSGATMIDLANATNMNGTARRRVLRRDVFTRCGRVSHLCRTSGADRGRQDLSGDLRARRQSAVPVRSRHAEQYGAHAGNCRRRSSSGSAMTRRTSPAFRGSAIEICHPPTAVSIGLCSHRIREIRSAVPLHS